MPKPKVTIEDEFMGADFQDARRSRRLEQLAATMAVAPRKSFPQALASAELEGAYRLFNSPHVTLDKMIEGHRRRSTERVGEHAEVVVAHDTSEFRFKGEKRRDLGKLGTSGQGFLAHVSLAVRPASRDPLGVLHVETWTRTGKSVAKKREDGELTHTQAKRSPARESLRWSRGVDEAERLVDGAASLIHVMDSEADDYALLGKLIADSRRFVIRLGYDRVALYEGATTKVKELASRTAAKLEREVYVSPRHRPVGGKDKRRQARDARMAMLTLSACSLSLRRPQKLSGVDGPKELPLNMVLVRERHPPADAEPIEWLLLTTEPIETTEHLCRVVDFYRQRWLIEEYFKALKTGCSMEARQLESLDALLTAFGLFIPIAWSLLRIRALSRAPSPVPAAEVLSEAQLQILQHHKRSKLTTNQPSARDALLAIAALGGHLKNNGEPGWLVLHRGYATLLELEEGFLLRTEI